MLNNFLGNSIHYLAYFGCGVPFIFMLKRFAEAMRAFGSGDEGGAGLKALAAVAFLAAGAGLTHNAITSPVGAENPIYFVIGYVVAVAFIGWRLIDLAFTVFGVKSVMGLTFVVSIVSVCLSVIYLAGLTPIAFWLGAGVLMVNANYSWLTAGGTGYVAVDTSLPDFGSIEDGPTLNFNGAAMVGSVDVNGDAYGCSTHDE